jgi:ComF family protein
MGDRIVRWRQRRLDRGRDLPNWSPDPPEAYCPRCGATCGPAGLTAKGCPFCINVSLPWHRITRLGVYAPPLDEAIKAMKFARDWARAGWLGRQLAAVLTEPTEPQKLIVCPVPLHYFRGWARGYNQSELIAEAVAHARGWLMLPLLKRVRHTQPQSTLPSSRRLTNLRRAFRPRKLRDFRGRGRPVDLTGYDILLIDDVKTTGATLSACSRLLKRHGARTIHCAVAAVADPKHQQFKTI